MAFLAELYGVETKRINEAVKRNKNKFPERFSWILTDEESKILLVAYCDQKKETRGGRHKNPRVFTEQGVAMLSTILKSKKAIETSISIIDAFVYMRHYLKATNSISLDRVMLLEEKVNVNTKRINELFNRFDPDLGKKCFDIHEIDDKQTINDFINNLPPML